MAPSSMLKLMNLLEFYGFSASRLRDYIEVDYSGHSVTALVSFPDETLSITYKSNSMSVGTDELRRAAYAKLYLKVKIKLENY